MKFRSDTMQNGRQNKNLNRRLGAGVKKTVVQRTFKGPQNGSVRIGDARLKIQQKKRNVVDARDVLAKMAQKQDARNKLIKIRATRTGSNPISTNVRAIGTSIIQKTDRNGKISLSTKKTTASIGEEVRKQLGLGAPQKQRQINQKKTNLAMLKQQRLQSNRLKLLQQRVDTHMSPMTRQMPNPTPIRRTILNDIMPDITPYQRPEELYSWIRPDMRMNSLDARRQQSMRITARNDFQEMPPANMHPWRGYEVSPNRSIQMQTSYVDLDAVRDEEMSYVDAPMPMIPSRPSTGIRARLDQVTPIQSSSHGIMSQTKTKVVVPAGHRIVISNLQTSVTQEDIRELFEDIGQLLVSRLVRPGTAEVIYKNLKDAQKAVDTYHNRQLDGQPMKCLLVNKRPINNPTGPAAKTALSTSDTRRAAAVKATHTKLTPDISTIHKVLFHNKT